MLLCALASNVLGVLLNALPTVLPLQAVATAESSQMKDGADKLVELLARLAKVCQVSTACAARTACSTPHLCSMPDLRGMRLA